VAIVAGMALQSVFLRAFRRARTHIEPWKPASALVTTGVYARTRNPAYIGMALIFAGIALAADVPWALVVLPVVLLVIDRYVIAREERYLARHFGAEYDAYRSRVRRWV
jgi:protein-S-isoprenylcysteine O-methyltransferase Ste14